MKGILFIAMAFFMTSMSAGVNPTPTKKNVKVGESTVKWVGHKVTGTHEGTIKIKEGTLDFEGDVLKSGTVVIDMNTIDCTDLSGGGEEKLVGHLKSDDFFGVAKFQTAKFDITKVVSRGTPGDYKVIGNMTIKGITKEVRFLATIKDGSASAAFKIDRTDYDVRYGSGSFMDNLGDKTIYDEFDISFSLKY